MTPVIDILLPSYNPMPFLKERLDSIFAQTYPHWTLTVLDSHSNDGSKELYDAIEDKRVNITYGSKEGIYPAWNKLLDTVKSDWVYIATADDTMYPNCLERCIKAISKKPEAMLIFFGIDMIDKTSKWLENWHLNSRRNPFYTYGEQLKSVGELSSKKEFIAQVYAAGGYQSITGVLFHRSVFETIGHFPIEFGPAGDTYWIMEAVRNFPIQWIPESLATWRLHEQQSSRQNISYEKGEISDRERAVVQALDNAVEVGYINKNQLELIKKYQNDKKSTVVIFLERVLNKLFQINYAGVKKSKRLEEILKLEGVRSL
jgi:glycosyltransferase involved in cell wall biosynthesis